MSVYVSLRARVCVSVCVFLRGEMRLRTACRTRRQATIPTKTLNLRLWPFKISRGTRGTTRERPLAVTLPSACLENVSPPSYSGWSESIGGGRHCFLVCVLFQHSLLSLALWSAPLLHLRSSIGANRLRWQHLFHQVLRRQTCVPLVLDDGAWITEARALKKCVFSALLNSCTGWAARSILTFEFMEVLPEASMPCQHLCEVVVELPV